MKEVKMERIKCMIEPANDIVDRDIYFATEAVIINGVWSWFAWTSFSLN